MSDDVQVTMFLRPDTAIETFDRVHSTQPDLRVVGLRIGNVTVHISGDDQDLADSADRLILYLANLRDHAMLRLPEPPEPEWLHETPDAVMNALLVAKAQQERRDQIWLDGQTRPLTKAEDAYLYGPPPDGWTEPERREAWGK